MSENVGARFQFNNFDFHESDSGHMISADMTSFYSGAVLSIDGTCMPSRTDAGYPFLRVSAPTAYMRSLAETGSGRRYFERLIAQPDPRRFPGVYLAATCVYIACNPALQMDDGFSVSPIRSRPIVICEYPEVSPAIEVDTAIRN